MSTLAIYLGLFGVFFALGSPIVLSLAISAIIMLQINGIDLTVFASKFMVSMDNFSLTAMFFFILAGEIMNGGGMTRRIVAVVSKAVKNIPGGLAIIAIISCGIFAAINGSAIATMIAISAILYPAMVKDGYPPAFAAACLAAGGVVGPIIPPSIPMIVYGSATGDSIAALFSGGVVLGILICGAEIFVVYFISKKRGYGGKTDTTTEFGSTKGVLWALLFPIIIFVSIVTGAMTATETSAFAVVYAFVIGQFVYKEFDIKQLSTMMRKSMKSSGTIMAIVGAASAVAWILTYNRVPQMVTEAMVASISSKSVFMVVTFFILFLVGMIMDLTPAIMILTPIFMGPVAAFNIDPVFFGVFFCAVLTAGLITPPVGTLIYLGCSQAKKSFGEMVKQLLPFVLAVYVVLFIVALVPQIITFLPKNVFKLY
ncbi:MAG: TRAP transporter large permease [Sphaerochaetaceae bacterium]|nr:TRAP transporter large permease [Sphaerochaetaceae bacterium]MDD3163352.1 TRAP transporter large permease [Sphaerochaetaceae bacterium]MDD4396822.1 TRAP transporter large permease [Sphaerochaetaceae bacterium]